MTNNYSQGTTIFFQYNLNDYSKTDNSVLQTQEKLDMIYNSNSKTQLEPNYKFSDENGDGKITKNLVSLNGTTTIGPITRTDKPVISDQNDDSQKIKIEFENAVEKPVYKNNDGTTKNHLLSINGTTTIGPITLKKPNHVGSCRL